MMKNIYFKSKQAYLNGQNFLRLMSAGETFFRFLKIDIKAEILTT